MTLPDPADAMTAADLAAHHDAMLKSIGPDWSCYVHLSWWTPETPAYVGFHRTSKANAVFEVRCATWREALAQAWAWLDAAPDREEAERAERVAALRRELAELEAPALLAAAE